MSTAGNEHTLQQLAGVSSRSGSVISHQAAHTAHCRRALNTPVFQFGSQTQVLEQHWRHLHAFPVVRKAQLTGPLNFASASSRRKEYATSHTKSALNRCTYSPWYSTHTKIPAPDCFAVMHAVTSSTDGGEPLSPQRGKARVVTVCTISHVIQQCNKQGTHSHITFIIQLQLQVSAFSAIFRDI
jgi:hypothetical protein